MYKTLIQTLLAGFYAILAASPLEGGGVMIAARQIAFGGNAKGLSAKDYIQDGLVAMWDGIENAGWGVHDPNATVWKDFTGNGYDMTINAGSTIGYDYIAHATKWVAGIGKSKSIPFTACEAVFLIRQGVLSTACVGLSSGRGNYTYIVADGAARIGIGQRGYNTNNYAGFDVPEIFVGARCSVSVNYSFGKYFGAKEAYLNSAPVTIAFGDVYPYNNAGVAFAVGGRYQGSLDPSSIQTGAYVCNIRLYSRALTAEEIAYNYNIDKQRFGL